MWMSTLTHYETSLSIYINYIFNPHILPIISNRIISYYNNFCVHGLYPIDCNIRHTITYT